MEAPAQWIVKCDNYPQDWEQQTQAVLNLPQTPRFAARLLWLRGVRDAKTLASFVNPNRYSPTPASAFGEEMALAVVRVQLARDRQEKLAIWGDFDADGITATAVLWEGLGRLFPPERLRYVIPNRLKESHGLSHSGLESLADWGASLVITCDTGSDNLAEVEYAQKLGLDIIVTDHHTLLEKRLPVCAIVNPRMLPEGHPLRTLSGVAVAYKLVEALYTVWELPLELSSEAVRDGTLGVTSGESSLDNWANSLRDSLEALLDLVAIGLVADLVELTGDCRYLAQRGLSRLQQQLQPGSPTRPGVAELLKLCKRSGDRPSDIAFGIGPRINAVSRIHGDAAFCVELLTSREPKRCRRLALEAELANTRRRALQRTLEQDVETRLAQLDLATTPAIVLADEQWPVGILGLVAGQIAQRYNRPTLLFTLEPGLSGGLARGSARSVAGLNLYSLFQAQRELLQSYGGHPMAAGLSLLRAHLPMFATALNRQVRELRGHKATVNANLTIDLTICAADLGQDLFRELKLLEPYGMGNPVPRLRIQNAWFERTWHRRLKDQRGRPVNFVKTQFELWDDTAQQGFPGVWWGHYREDLPAGRCDVVVELDHSSQHGYHVRLVAVQSLQAIGSATVTTDIVPTSSLPERQPPPSPLPSLPTSSPSSPPPRLQRAELTPVEVWTRLLGLAKYLSRTGKTVAKTYLQEHLALSATSLRLGLTALEAIGFVHEPAATHLQLEGAPLAEAPVNPAVTTPVNAFLEAIAEEQFRRRYQMQAGERRDAGTRGRVEG